MNEKLSKIKENCLKAYNQYSQFERGGSVCSVTFFYRELFPDGSECSNKVRLHCINNSYEPYFCIHTLDELVDWVFENVYLIEGDETIKLYGAKI